MTETEGYLHFTLPALWSLDDFADWCMSYERLECNKMKILDYMKKGLEKIIDNNMIREDIRQKASELHKAFKSWKSSKTTTDYFRRIETRYQTERKVELIENEKIIELAEIERIKVAQVRNHIESTMKVHQQITNDIVDFSQKQNDYSVSSTFPSVSQALYINHSSKRTLDSTILTSSERIKKIRNVEPGQGEDDHNESYEIDNFFKGPSEKKSSNLFLQKKDNSAKKQQKQSNERGFNEADDEKDKDESEARNSIFISEENDDSGFFSLGQPASDTEGQSPPPLLVTEKHELPYCLNCCAEISNFSLIIFCPYCGTKIVSSEDESDTDEENDTGDKDEEDDTPPKVDKDMDYEHHAHSYIVDFDDEDIKALFGEEEWKELTKDRIGVPPVPHDIAKELTKYGKKTLKELRAVVLTPYLKENEEYDVNKHYELEWIQMALRTLCNLYENVDAPLIRKQYEDWFTVALFGACIDFCFRDIQLGTDIKRTDAPSLSSANRKNRDRKANTRTRKLTGRKIDGIIYTVDKLLEVGAIEGARSYSGVSDQKYLIETFKMPKTLRDMYVDIMKAVGYDDQKANKIQVIGILHLGLWIQFARLWRAGGSICIFRKDPLSYNVDSKFSEMGVISFLKLLISIYQYKIITKDNLQVLNIRNNIKPEDDLTNELMKETKEKKSGKKEKVEVEF
ncbi:C2H2-type zinc finger transcription factor [Rhizophagus clarus]|uniref:C2H2-type zinc finger transcription factor n=1 Tax=Rhizophagus clarus TaxID=94130 RepID=A0A8H3M6Y7_9GLOM|nr:C2H2-type zinc finger transcription factor [Rhizophagus clarus]